jgi:hypothetical protein
MLKLTENSPEFLLIINEDAKPIILAYVVKPDQIYQRVKLEYMTIQKRCLHPREKILICKKMR